MAEHWLPPPISGLDAADLGETGLDGAGGHFVVSCPSCCGGRRTLSVPRASSSSAAQVICGPVLSRRWG